MAKPNRKVFWASHIYLGGVLLFSFGHFLIQGDHFWTEEGARFSWSLPLRKKACSFHIQDKALLDPVGNLLWHRIDFEKLTLWQRNHMTDPFLFALYVKAQFCPTQDQALTQVSCRAIGRKQAELIDSKVNLCQTNYNFRQHNLWIQPEPGESESEFRQWFSFHPHEQTDGNGKEGL